MCQLACDEASYWLMTDAWEALNETYQTTVKVLDHFDHEINRVRGGALTPQGESFSLSTVSMPLPTFFQATGNESKLFSLPVQTSLTPCPNRVFGPQLT